MSAILVQTNNKFEEFLIENNFNKNTVSESKRAQKINKYKESH